MLKTASCHTCHRVRQITVSTWNNMGFNLSCIPHHCYSGQKENMLVYICFLLKYGNVFSLLHITTCILKCFRIFWLAMLLCVVNVVAMLHNFWEQKQISQSSSSSTKSDGLARETGYSTDSLLLYESAPSPGSSFVCYVTLPGGSCFGNYKVFI